MNRVELVDRLSIAASCVGNSNLVKEYNYLGVRGSKVTANNGVCSVMVPLEDPVGFVAAVPGVEFVRLLKDMSAKEVSFVKDGNSLQVKSGRSKGEFGVLSEIPGALDHDPNGLAWHTLGEDLRTGLLKASMCVSKDLRGVLRAVLVDGKRLIATDRNRIIRYNLEDKHTRFILPLEMIRLLGKYKKEITKISELNPEDGLIRFRHECGAIFTTQVLQEDYPDLNPHFPDFDKLTTLEFSSGRRRSEGIHTVVERQLNFMKEVKEFDKETVINVDGDTCTLTSLDHNKAQLVDTVALGSDTEEELEFTVNLNLLKDVLETTRMFYFEKSKGLIGFKTDKFEYITLTKRKQKEEK